MSPTPKFCCLQLLIFPFFSYIVVGFWLEYCRMKSCVGDFITVVPHSVPDKMIEIEKR